MYDGLVSRICVNHRNTASAYDGGRQTSDICVKNAVVMALSYHGIPKDLLEITAKVNYQIMCYEMSQLINVIRNPSMKVLEVQMVVWSGT